LYGVGRARTAGPPDQSLRSFGVDVSSSSGLVKEETEYWFADPVTKVPSRNSPFPVWLEDVL